MKNICIILFLACLVGSSFQFCYQQPFPDGDVCIAKDGTIMSRGESHDVVPDCLRCTCSGGRYPGLEMSCCGYGINAGTFGLPDNCEMKTEADGCTPRIVCN